MEKNQNSKNLSRKNQKYSHSVCIYLISGTIRTS